MSPRFSRLVVTTLTLATMTAVIFALPSAPTPGFGLTSAPASTDAAPFQGRGRGGGGAQAQPVEPLKFQYMGPAPAGRIASVVGVPGDPTTYYLGNASGGVWKSTDSGATFVPVFDDQPVQAIGALAISMSDHNQVWAGTGEGWVIRPSDVMGDGVYKSVDAGKTWTHMGLDATGRIGRIVVHPTDPNIVYVCAVGRANGPQKERGVFKTADGGKTWTQSLFVNQDTGCSGLSMDAKNPNILIAGAWQLVQRTWQQYSGGPGSAVYMTKDAGATWKKVERGMPRSPVGKIDVAIAPSDSTRIYALIQTADQGSLWRSDDGGDSFSVVSWDRSLIGRAGYYVRLGVNPQNKDDVIVMNSGYHRSSDGGKLFPGGRGGGGGCGDCHDVWFDPTDGTRFVLTDDGGASITTKEGSRGVRLPNGQMYHVAVDNRVPYWIYSNRQDDGTMRGPSTSPTDTGNGRLGPEPAAAPAAAGRGGFPGGAPGGGRGGGRGGGPAWEPGLGGCESGFTQPQPDNADIVWGSCYGNKLTRWDARVGTARSVSPDIITFDSASDVAKHRCHWTAPVAFDAFDPTTVYYGCEIIWKTSNEGQTWTQISPDLSTKDPRLIVASGGVVQDNLGQFAGATVYAIASSPKERGLLWAGTNDGKVWYTRDGGGKWVDVTANMKGTPELGTITQIWPSTFDAGTAYVTIDGHVNDNRMPFIFKTTDYGRTWTSVVGNLPTGHNLDYVMTAVENSNRKGMLFAGTGHAFYYSMDDGAHWTRFKEGLPASVVSWIVYEPRYHDVVVSTYGRGLFIMHDITVLEQTGQTTAPPPATKLFTPRNGFRQPRSGSADFVFSLAAAPAGPIKMEILNSEGAVIRTQNVTGARAGLNKASWNLQYEPAKMVEIRTTPKENQYIWEEPDFSGSEVRMVTHWGIGATTATPIGAPGKYSVRMTIDGQVFTEPFEVVKDPAIKASVADLVESTKMQVRIRDAITETSLVVNQLEITRKQIEDLLKANRGKDEIEKPLMDLDAVLFGTELKLVTRQDLRSDDKYFADAYKVYMNLLWLGGAVGLGAGDEGGGADYKPRDVAYTILADQLKQLADAQKDFDKHITVDVPAFNKTMNGKIPAVQIKRSEVGK